MVVCAVKARRAVEEADKAGDTKRVTEKSKLGMGTGVGGRSGL